MPHNTAAIEKSSLIQLEKVLVDAIKRIDIEMFKEFYVHVEENMKNEKLAFIKHFEIALNKFKSVGDTYLNHDIGICEGCYKGSVGHLFTGNKSENYFKIIFVKEGNCIKPITECVNLNTTNNILDLEKRIFIYPHNDPKTGHKLRF